MKSAAEKWKKIKDIKFINPSFEIVNNVTANPVTDSVSIKRLLIKQIFSTVKWREESIKDV